MSSDKNRSVDPRVRLAIARWPDDAPRGAVTTFCAEHSISRKTFYVLRRRARLEGPAAVLEPRSRRPRTSPARLPEAVRSQALEVRAALERSGLDHGPISVHDKMASMGLKAPSPAWLARLFRDQGVARSEPSKRPRAAWRRFVYPAPNACWQLDATEYVITQGRKVVIFQLQDDHSRLAVASLVASSETSQAAIDVFDKGVAARGVPQRLRGRQRHRSQSQPARSHRTPGGARALPGGRAHHLQALPPHHPGQERALPPDPVPLPGPAAPGRLHRRAPGRRVDRFDHTLQHQRPHQGLPGRITPQQAWDATEVAQAPRPDRDTAPITPGGPAPQPDTTARRRVRRHKPIGATGQRELTVGRNGTVHIGGIAFLVNRHLAASKVIAIWDTSTITFADTHGEVLIQYTWPPHGTSYVSHHPPDPTNQRGGRGRKRP